MPQSNVKQNFFIYAPKKILQPHLHCCNCMCVFGSWKIFLESDTLRSKSKKRPLTFCHSSNALQSVVCFDATINILILRKIDTKWRPGIAHLLCVNRKEYWLQILKYCNCPQMLCNLLFVLMHPWFLIQKTCEKRNNMEKVRVHRWLETLKDGKRCNCPERGEFPQGLALARSRRVSGQNDKSSQHLFA